MLNIAVLNSSTAMTDDQVQAMLGAFAVQWNGDLSTAWNVEDATFTFVPKGQAPLAESWWLVFLDNSDQAKTLAYHDLTNEGLPLSKVFIKTIQADGASVSVGATHELCEMAVDPWLNSAYQDSQGTFWAGEICDPVEDDQYGYMIDGVLVTDFVTPNWFAHKFSQMPYDKQSHADKAFAVLTGGYAQKFEGNGWVQVTGAKAMTSQMATASYGSRRERRTRQDETWINSSPTDREMSRKAF